VDDLDQHAAEVAVDPADHAVQIRLVELARVGPAEVVERDRAVAAVHMVGQPGEGAGQPARRGQRQRLDHADQDPNREVNRVVHDARTLLGHVVTPLTNAMTVRRFRRLRR
jgi:hypothetical protein